MANKKLGKGVVLVSILVLPFLIYFIFVYSAEENFFVTLEYVGPKEVETSVQDGETVYDTSYYSIPDWRFTTQDDTLLREDDLRDNIYLANFFFATCPSICPAMNYNVQQVQERFKGYENLKIVSFTVNPENDSVEVLKAYEDKIGARPGKWYFLTGDQEELYQTARDYFANAMVDSAAPGGYLHSSNLYLIDWEGRIRSGRLEDGSLPGVYDGLSVDDVNRLKSDIKVLIAELEKQKSIEAKNEEDKLKEKNL